MKIEYLAGIIDVEGTMSIFMDGGKMVPSITVANTNKKLLDEIFKFLKANGVKSEICMHKARSARHKDSYSLRVRWNAAIRLASMLDGFLIIKTEQCKLLVNDFRKRTPRNGKYSQGMLASKNKLIARFRKLNSRGV
jgi:DNA-binding transcriptional regulator WhiA